MTLRSTLPLLLLLTCWKDPGTHAAEGPQSTSAQEPLTLSRALSRVIERNPELAVSELEIEAAAARVLQAGVKPNPEFTAEAENFGALNGAGFFRYTESTLLMSQKIELGGKRSLRVQAAESRKGVAGVELEVRKNRLLTDASQAFADVLVAQQLLENQRELRRLSEEARSIVGERVTAGKVSPVEETRAVGALAAARLEEEKQGLELVAAKDRLAALWGGTHEDIDSLQGAFEIPPMTSGVADSCLENNPELRLALVISDSRRATLELERAYRKPDLTVSAGFRYLNLEDVPSWAGGVTIPIPVFDKNQGAIAEARIRLNQSQFEQQAVARRLRASLLQARNAHSIALREATALTQAALPAAKDAVSALEEGYRLGKFDYLNVLDAQRTYAELQRRYIQAIASGLKAAIEIDRLARCGASVIGLQPAPQPRGVSHEN